MLASEKLELEIYKRIKAFGTRKVPMTLSTLHQATGEDHAIVVERLKDLEGENRIALSKYSGGQQWPRTEFGNDDNKFFYTGSFFIEIVPEGRKYFEKLELLADEETISQINIATVANNNGPRSTPLHKRLEDLNSVALGFFEKSLQFTVIATHFATIWDKLSDDLKSESTGLRATLRPIIIDIADALHGSLLLTELDFIELRRNGKIMDAALRYRRFEQWDAQVIHNEDRVLGMRPAGQEEYELYSAAEAKDIFAVAYERILEALDFLPREIDKLTPTMAGTSTQQNKIFIGHGKSALWRELKDFLQDELKLPYEEFNRESPAGFSTTERLNTMLSGARFAFIVMTAEDDHSDGTKHARENVIHEAGLFQGKLGFERAIILLEDGCAEFSNIFGLTQIRFPKGVIKAAFEDIRKVLKREGILADPTPTKRKYIPI